MPTLREILTRVMRIEHSPSGPLVEKTVAEALHALAPASGIFTSPGLTAPAGTVRVAVVPKNVQTLFTFVNPDGGSASYYVTWY